MLYVGVDYGLSGGIACLDLNSRPLFTAPMPTHKDSHGKNDIDVVRLKGHFLRILEVEPCEDARNIFVVAEWCHTFGHEKPSTMFSFGRGIGKVQSLMELMGIAFEEVIPQAWKKEILCGTKQDKPAAIGYALKRWPDAIMKVGKSDRYSDGIADSLCLAEFARRRLVGS